jgi:anti-sigma regulatory factor (Ser/Thr protein kinase)
MTEALSLGAEPRSPREARRLVESAIDATRWPGDRQAAMLLASEVATNSIRHGGDITHFEVSIFSARLHVESRDRTPVEPKVREVDSSSACGRGMALVDMLSDAWGVRQEPGDGKTVWFELSADHRPFG